MKTFIALLTSLAILAGCATQNTAGRVLATSVQTVDAAMQGWWTYEALGHAKPDQVSQVRKAYATWQAAEAVAETAYVAATKTGDTSNWQRAADALRASQAALLTLVNQFSQPPPNP